MANEQNLIPFKPGQSGNPKGRPKSRVPEQLVKIFGSKARAKKFYSLSAGEIDEWESAILSMSANDLKLLAKWDEAPAYPKGYNQPPLRLNPRILYHRQLLLKGTVDVLAHLFSGNRKEQMLLQVQ